MLFVVFLFVFLLWSCETPRAFSSVKIRDSSLYSLKSKNFELRIFVGHDNEPIMFKENSEYDYRTAYQYVCKEKECVISGFVRWYCENSCTIEWVVDSVVIKRVTLLDHPDQGTMEFTTDVDGERHTVMSESLTLDLDSLMKK